MRLQEAAARLRDATARLPLDAPYIYRPLDYAWAPHAAYLARRGAQQGRVALVGMNPGPWGMAQTGVPFADPAWARWIGVEGEVRAPASTHPARPVLGFASTRRDPSGAKLYGWAKARFGDADRFFARFFVANHCPVMLLDEAGRNVPLPALRGREALERACDAWMREALDALAPVVIVALGRYVHDRLARLELPAPLRLARHPSPANPANNAGWGEELEGLAQGI